ncbi:MAG TPA: DUF1223 domain-containing protein [Rhizomicrobium sp.]|jgi:hypothetical protein|nr:DUF1223 domain-containing protein [Rhizomicrobium sp.]
MKGSAVFGVVAAGVVALLVSANAIPAVAAGAHRLTVVELFQSQGCSDCPPANANVMALSGRPDLLTLSFGVTYWDQLGWKDTFAEPQYTARQWDYAHSFGRTEVFTPEVVVNGKADVVGADRNELEALIARQANKAAPAAAVGNGVATIGFGKGKAQVWLVRFDPNVVQVPIARGENRGRTLPHKNVVRQLVRLGEWSGKSASYRLPDSKNPAWTDAILLQAGPGGPIIAAARSE